MLVYLDESGDTGFKFNRGSSRFFVVTIMLVVDPLPFHAAVDTLRFELGFAAHNEFKWHNSSESTRWAFLRMLRRQDCNARVLVIDKTLLTAVAMRREERLYNIFLRTVLEHDDGTIRDATVILDESVKSKQSKQRLTTYLRRELNTNAMTRRIKEIRYHKSHADNLIQATDMLSGAIYAQYRNTNPEYLDFIRVKIGDLREWPRAQ